MKLDALVSNIRHFVLSCDREQARSDLVRFADALATEGVDELIDARARLERRDEVINRLRENARDHDDLEDRLNAALRVNGSLRIELETERSKARQLRDDFVWAQSVSRSCIVKANEDRDAARKAAADVHGTLLEVGGILELASKECARFAAPPG